MPKWKHNIYGVKRFDAGFDIPIRKGDDVTIAYPEKDSDMQLTREGEKAKVINVWRKLKEYTIKFEDGEEMLVPMKVVKKW